MAELDTSGGGGKHKGGKVRTKKKATRVDLTAMVDLAFLLITFFILTTTLSKPKSMELVMPDKSQPISQAVAETKTMTLLLGKGDKYEWFVGIPGKTQPTVGGYTNNAFRKLIIEQNKKIMDTHNGEQMIVIVKPSDKSTYKNVVTVMDELNITNIQSRAIVDISPVEAALLKRENLL